MNKSSITTLLIGVGSAVAVLYELGIFDNSPSSISIQTSNITNATSASIAGYEVAIQTETASATGGSTSKILSAINVAKHVTQNDCWVIIDNNVYDITSYIPEHRKAQRDVIASCGTDATIAFTDVNKHMRPDVQAVLPSFLLGAVAK